MRNLYKYSGTIDSFSFSKSGPENYPSADIILSELGNDEKPPTRLEANGALAEYINDIEGTDAEERYITSDWYYDHLLFLHRIEIPSSDPHMPAKIITMVEPLSRELAIFGPADYIETSEPEPMSREQFLSWLNFHSRSIDKTGWK